MDSVAFLSDVQLGPDDAAGGSFGCSSDPEFHGFFFGGVNGKGFGGVVVAGGGEDSFDIGAVVEFGQSEAAEVLHVDSSEEGLSVFFCSQQEYGPIVEVAVHSSQNAEVHVVGGESVGEEGQSVGFRKIVISDIIDALAFPVGSLEFVEGLASDLL